MFPFVDFCIMERVHVGLRDDKKERYHYVHIDRIQSEYLSDLEHIIKI